MKVGFLGDVHGHVFHVLAVIAEWQRRAETQLDLIVQVGDLGAISDVASGDHQTHRFAREDPAELDFPRLLTATGPLAQSLHKARRCLASPIVFIRGNHDDAGWLTGLPTAAGSATVPVDPFDLFRYVPDGTVLVENGVYFGFLGGIETTHPHPATIDPAAYAGMIARAPGSLDVLVTHDPPLGAGEGHRSTRQGSALVSALDTHLAPSLHIGGHVHAAIGPKQFSVTTYYGCAILVPAAQHNPRHAVGSGSFAVWDTETGAFTFVSEPWLRQFDGHFDFVRYMAAFNA